MSGITGTQRRLGWNVVISVGSSNPFGGFYQQDGLVSVAEATRELNLCFVFEKPDSTNDWQSALLPMANATSMIFLEETNNAPFPTPPASEAAEYTYVFHHTDCTRTGVEHSPKDPCIRPAKHPHRRSDPRYLPIGRSADHRVLRTVPLRGKKRTRNASTSTSSPSRSLSPTKGGDESNDDEFPEAIIPQEEARPIINDFRQSILATGHTCCAISKKGRSWWNGGASLGPTIQAAHIVPQIHWNVYPNDDQGVVSMEDNAGLRDAWNKTWQLSNGLLLASNLHQCFDARLISIDPDTSLIRAFVPYDMIMDFHNTTAYIPKHIDRYALRHHYDMCCIENMSAIRWAGVSMPPSGTRELSIVALPSSPNITEPNLGPVQNLSDPQKRSQSTQGNRQNNSNNNDKKNNFSSNVSDLLDKCGQFDAQQLPPSPPSSEPRQDSSQGRMWRLGGLIITNPQAAEELKRKGWLVEVYESDCEDEEGQDSDTEGQSLVDDDLCRKEEEQRGRSRKRQRVEVR
ncbi:hypothetical protein F5Y10DRAFT_230734 [Nemania abortiva]|nr:hypothetical protein F5Y10DRAFT_230734 [Nemania abortiva]